MNPKDLFCPNMACPARGQIGRENISIHSQKDKRYLCDVCQESFTETKGTIFYQLRTDPKIVLQVITPLAHGCPIQAIVQAFGLDEQTVQD
jgi:transposase-like protein